MNDAPLAPHSGADRRRLVGRPLASVATIANSIIIISALVGGGVASFGFFADIKSDIRVLQREVAISNQVADRLSNKVETLSNRVATIWGAAPKAPAPAYDHTPH